MAMDVEKVSLATLMEGGAIEVFDDELQKALDHFKDPNTDAKKARKVFLCVEFKSNDENRTMVDVHLWAESKLPKNKPHATKLLVAEDGGHAYAAEMNLNQGAPGQGRLPGTDRDSMRRSDSIHEVYRGRTEKVVNGDDD